MIFSIFQKIWDFLGILGPPYCGTGATIRIGQEMLCLPYAGFFIKRNKKTILFQMLMTAEPVYNFISILPPSTPHPFSSLILGIKPRFDPNKLMTRNVPPIAIAIVN